MRFASKFVMDKKFGVLRTKSGNELFAQGRCIQQLAVSQCIDLSTAAGTSANCFHCCCHSYTSVTSGLDRSTGYITSLHLFFQIFKVAACIFFYGKSTYFLAFSRFGFIQKCFEMNSHFINRSMILIHC